MDRNQALQNIAKKGKIEVASLEPELAEIIETLPQSPDRERLALMELNRRHSGPPDKTSKFDICVVGLYKLGDFSSKTFKTALAKYKADPEGAEDQGMVKVIDGVPTVLDMQKTINYGKGDVENKNYNKPLEHSYTRTVRALIKEEESTEWILDKIELRGDFAYSSVPDTFVTLNTNLLGTMGKDLKTAKSTKFNPSTAVLDITAELTKLGKDHIIALGDAFEEAKLHSEEIDGKNAFYDRFIITSGMCKFMNDPKIEGNSFNGTFDDFTTDEMVGVFVDPNLGKPEIGKEYTLIAQSGIKKGWDNEKGENTDEDILVMNILGFYA